MSNPLNPTPNLESGPRPPRKIAGDPQKILSGSEIYLKNAKK